MRSPERYDQTICFNCCAIDIQHTATVRDAAGMLLSGSLLWWWWWIPSLLMWLKCANVQVRRSPISRKLSQLYCVLHADRVYVLCTYSVRMLLLQQYLLSLPSILLISTTASASQVTSPHGVLFTQLAISGDRINTNCPPSLQTDPDKVHTVQSTLYIQPIILWFPSVTHIICSQRGFEVVGGGYDM